MANKTKGAIDESVSLEDKAAGFPIVGIGASAGGLDPIRELLEHLPIDTGMAFVVIQHLGAGQESLLPEILSRSTKMNVLQVTDGMKVENNHVYVIPPGTTMTFKNGCLHLVTKGSSFKPINDFMISLASERKTSAIGIVLSGTGNDGTLGLKAIKAEGGISFVQDPDAAQYSDMPKNAIISEAPDFVLSPEHIVEELVRIAHHPQFIPLEKKTSEAKIETDIRKIIMMIKTSFGVDFSHYKETTINRRITRRMVINKTPNLKEYVEYLRTHPNELQALFDDLLIGVTSFFREPNTFGVLKENVFPDLIKKRSRNAPIRVWVPGCSTGEEVYSLAIAIQEFLEEKTLPEIRVQFFGTDANEKNIEKARKGLYPKIIEDNVTEGRLKRFFNRQNGNYEITKIIRDMCIFAKQDITIDPPFSNLDLIMCRNVLIYFDSVLHERVFPIFHYALKPNGFLVLGESESIGKFQFLFEPISPRGTIYKRKQAQPQLSLNADFAFESTKPSKKVEKKDVLAGLGEKVDHLLTSEYGPAALLVNNNLDILVFRGDVAPYLSPESGAASFNITKIIRKEFRSQVQTAIYVTKKEKKAFRETVHYKQKGQPKTVNIEIRPLETPQYDEPFFLVLFTEAPNDIHLTHEVEAVISPGEAESLKDRQIRELKEDVEAAKQSMQMLVEGQEATNEELKSSMEEVQSSNEELQSTNEELETAKEELQSSNEELHTLNEELKNRNQSLGRLNDDLANLQTNLDIAVVIVDSALRIRRFTATAQKLLRILPSDVGGSIANITPGVHIEDLDKTVTEVIDKLTPVSQEVEGLEGNFYEIRVRPYLTEDKKIDGAFLSFTDITKRKKAEEALDKYTKNLEKLVEERTKKLELSSLYARNLIEASLDPLVTINAEGKITDVNEATEQATGCSREELIGSDFSAYFTEPQKAKNIYKQVLTKGFVRDYPLAIKHESGKIIDVSYNATVYRNADGQIQGIFAAARDITELKKAEEEAKENEKKLKDSERLAAIGATAGMVGHDIRNPLQAITGDVYLAKTELASSPDSEEKRNALESLEEIEKNVEYINKIVQDLQDYSRPLNPKMEESDLKPIIEALITKNGLPENIKVAIEISDDSCKVITDSYYLNRILANLVSNAVQAMPSGGKLTVSAHKEANDVVLTVKDTGVGIPKDIQGKMFTLMFTTKSKGQGFGLPVVKRMTESLGGTVSFLSQEGKGTTFTVRLPRPQGAKL
jgi:two-component system, chemotaxis family, CheB/CheR fusion protein